MAVYLSSACLGDCHADVPACHRRIEFGKHKGKLLGSLPDSYLRWMVSVLKPGRWSNLAQEVLHERRVDALERQLGAATEMDSSYASMLRQCCSSRALAQGKLIHAHMIETGHDKDTFLGNLLIYMYGKCGSIEDARAVFDKIQRNVFSWNIMISAYVQNGYSREALELFQELEPGGTEPTGVTFVSVLGACSRLGALAEGKAIHARLDGFQSDLIVQNAVLNMYGKCGSLDAVRNVFARMSQRDIFSWNAVIAAYAQHGHGGEAVLTYRRMDLDGVEPDQFTFPSVLAACSSLGALAEGKAVHARVVVCGLDSDVFVQNALVNMYAKCDHLQEAEGVFNRMLRRDVVTWTAMVAAYAQHGHAAKAIRLYQTMLGRGCTPNSITFISVLEACSLVEDLEAGKAVHGDIIACSLDSDVAVATALLGMYAKCGSLHGARCVFDGMRLRNVLLWTALISAYAQHGHGREALCLYHQMETEGVVPDSFTYASVVAACSIDGDLGEGHLIHEHIVNAGVEIDVVVGTALVSMYGKCGSVDDACLVFQKMQKKDVLSWNALIAAHAQYGHGNEALELFREMLLQGFDPNGVTFISVLHSCFHRGMLEEGWQQFVSMSDHSIRPATEHYTCVIGLLGRAGFLDDAEALASNLSVMPDAVSWRMLLDACRIHGDEGRGARAAGHANEVEPGDASFFVLLSHIYAAC